MDSLTRRLRGRRSSRHGASTTEELIRVARRTVDAVSVTPDLSRQPDEASARTPIQRRYTEDASPAEGIPMLPIRSEPNGREERDSSVSFSRAASADSQVMRASNEAEAHDEINRLHRSVNSHGSDPQDEGESNPLSHTSSSAGLNLHKKSEGLVVSYLPAVPDPEQERKAFWRAVEGLGIVIGGWTLLIVSCYLFKALALHYNLAIPDASAVWIKEHPTATTQVFSVIGVTLAEICFQLWETAIEYFATRRLAYGRNRSEILTYVAWAKLKRGGYTWSRRKIRWPYVTLTIWMGTNFFAPGWTTLLTPSPMTQFTSVQWPELDMLGAAYTSLVSNPDLNDSLAFGILDRSLIDAACSPDRYIASLVSRSQDGSMFTLDNCPQYSNVEALMRAGLTKLQASHNVSNALLKVGNATFLGGTGGVAPLGPQGILPGDDAKETPSGIRRPKDFDFKYATLQQGMGVEVKCQRTNPQAAQPLMSSEWIENLPGYANVTYFCPRGVGQRESTSIGIYTVQSVAASVCHSLKSPVITGDILDAENPIYDPDYSVISLLDFFYQPLQSSSTWLAAASNRTGSQTNLTTIGGDVACSVKPYFSNFFTQFDSNMQQFTAFEDPTSTREYTTGQRGELYSVSGPSNIASNNRRAQARFVSFVPGLVAMSEVFQAANVVGHLTFDPARLPDSGVPTSITASNTLLVGENTAVNLLTEYLLGRNGVGTISMPDLEIFMQGVFEYTSSAMRLVRTYDISDDNNELTEPGTSRAALGSWNATTLGYGDVKGGDNTPTVYLSLIPFILFALLSWSLVGWSHYYDRPRGSVYLADCDPTEIVDCIIAASPGGLQGAFHRRALHKQGGGLKGARGVKIRLGHVYKKGHVDQEPQLGLVDVD